jgi:hypothetical protein
MTTLREAAERALKSLEDAIKVWTEEMEFRSCIDASDEWLESYDALREALDNDQPFGYFQYSIQLDAWVQNRINNKGVAFYTTPPQRKPLTDEEILEAWKPFEGNPFTTKYEFARAIERAHGIGEKE